MKKLIVFFGILSMSAVVSVAGGDNLYAPAIAIVRSGTAIKVFYTTEESRFARVSILDHRGNRVFNEVVKSKKGFICSCDVSKLACGQYVVQVADSTGSWSETFIIDNAPDGDVRNTKT
ncbi:hypothetical protein QQ054_03435 [Oscillatoria amoena NRMC-F 0135]|nr:hypothetical protein [Oscillatoria amoena NRMC-F 0135]